MTRRTEEFFHNRLARWFFTFTVNALTIIVFGWCGYLLDSHFGTKPWIFLGALVLSFPVSLMIQVHKIKKL